MADSPYSSLKVDLAGQTAVVTGASQGLGKAMALALATNGAKVACVARSADKLADTVHVGWSRMRNHRRDARPVRVSPLP